MIITSRRILIMSSSHVCDNRVPVVSIIGVIGIIVGPACAPVSDVRTGSVKKEYIGSGMTK